MKSTEHPTIEEVAAELRAEYAKFTPEQRARYGSEPDENIIACRWARIHCSRHTEEERAANIACAMSIIYGSTAKSHAQPEYATGR